MADETAAIMLGLTIQENDKITISMPVIHSNAPSFTSTMNSEKKDDGVVNNQEVAEDNGSDDVKEDADRDDANGATTAANDDGNAGDNTPTNTTTTNNETNNATTIETPLSTPRRRIKKRRDDNFVYAEDTKAEKSSAPDSNKQPPLEKLAPTIFKPPPLPSSATTKLPTKPPPLPRKRPRKCPAKDSILIEVPLSVTADLGVAMRRTRRKRIKRIKEWVASGAKAAAASSAASGVDDESKSNKKSMDENDETKKAAGGGDKEEKVASKSSALDDNEDELEDSDGEGGPLHRKQYGSVLDYLEAKYVRGVMIEDYDEKERSKEKKKSSNTNTENAEEEEEESDDSEGKGSCYDSDGWIDDTGLHEEVAGQVMASSAYGMTQIENEARRRKLEKREREKSTTENGDDEAHKLEGAGMEEEDKQSDADDRSEEGGADSDFDDGFFVNLGDLEMAEGWKGENDFSFTAKEKKVKKRAYNKKTKPDKSDKAAGAKSKTVKKKNINVKAVAPGAKKKLPKKLKEKKPKEGGKTETKKKGGKAKKSDEKSKRSDEKSKKSEDKSKKSEDNPPTPKQKKKKAAVSVLESVTSPDKNEGEGEAAAEKEPAKKSTPASDKDSKTDQKSASPKEKKKAPEMSKEKEKAIQLRKVYKKKYNGCVKMMKEMTSEELPKKQKKKSVMMKVSVNIPPDKSIGDEITFGNPNVPGQKLKVKIPKKADMEKRNFVVSVPGPKVKAPELRENNFAKEFKEALYNFACSYDDWCAAEGEHNDSLPASKRKQFKPNTEKLKKFDELITEFPKNLVTPIDVSYLRKIVRQERSNKSRREKRKDCGGSSVADGKGEWTDQPLQETEINIPQKGMDFEDIVFCRRDFEGK